MKWTIDKWTKETGWVNTWVVIKAKSRFEAEVKAEPYLSTPSHWLLASKLDNK